MVIRLMTSVMALLCMLATLVVPAFASPQSGPRRAPPDPLAGLRVGQWIEIEGVLKDAAPIACTRVRQLAGDFLDDDWALRGTVARLNAGAREFVIGRCRVRLNDRTTFGHPKQAFRTFSDLRNGMLVEVEGAFLDGGVLLAAEVDDESDELVRRPGLRDEVKLIGKIERLDARKRQVTVMGMDFAITGATRIRTVLK